MDKTQALVKKFTRTEATEYEVPPMDMEPPIYPNRGVPHVGEPRGQDITPAWLTPGEAVIPKEAVDDEPYTIARLISKGRAIQDAQQEYNPKYFMSDRVHYANQGLQVPPTIANIEEEVRVLRNIHGGNTEGVIQGLMANVGLSREEAIMAIRNKNDGGIVYANSGNFSIFSPSTWFGGGSNDSWVTDPMLDSLRMEESSGIHFDPSKAGQQGYDAQGYRLSDAGAIGAYQWMPKSAANAGYNVKPFDIYDESAQRKATRQYLEGMQKHYPDWSKEDVLMAYNWGPGNVEAWKAGLIPDSDIPQESINYSEKVLSGVPSSVAPNAGSGINYKRNFPQNKYGMSGYSGLPNMGSVPPSMNPNINNMMGGPNSGQVEDYSLTSDIISYLGKKGKNIYDKIITAYKMQQDVELNAIDHLGNTVIRSAQNVTISALETVLNDKDFKGDKNKLRQKIEEMKKESEKKQLELDQNKAANQVMLQPDPEQTTFPYDDDSVNVESGEPKIIPEGWEGELDAFGYPIVETTSVDSSVEVPTEEETENNIESQTNNFKDISNLYGRGFLPQDITEDQAAMAAQNAPKDWTDRIAGAFKNAFSALFNEDELARMAIMYAGSRLFGYDHGDSIVWATKGYLNRIEGIESARLTGLKERGNKALTKDMIENFEKNSIDKWVITNNRNDLIPLKEEPLKIMETIGYGFDNRPGKNKKIEKVKMSDKTHAYMVDGQPRSWGWIKENLAPGSIDIEFTDEHSQLKMSAEYEKLIRSTVGKYNDLLSSGKIKLSDGTTASVGDANVLASQMAAYALNKHSEYSLNTNQKSKLNIALQNAASKYLKAMDTYLREGGDKPAFEGYANRETIVLQTNGALGARELKNVSVKNSELLLKRFQKLVDPSGDPKADAKVMHKNISDYKREWHKAKERGELHSYGKSFNDSFNTDGWNAMSKWMYDMLTENENGKIDPPDSALKVMYTQASINKYLASKPRNQELLKEIK